MKMYLDRAKVVVYRQIARRRGSRLLVALGRIAGAYIRALDNVNYDIHTNGEEEVLRRVTVAAEGQTCLFDVGANVGEWTSLAHSLARGTEIHAFEIVPETFEALRRSVGQLPGVRLNNVGLGSSDREVSVDIYPGDSSRASTVFISEEPERHSTVVSRVMKGDEYCANAGIRRIHFLKIDTEGADFEVLEGFSRMLTEGRIDVIQFEYGTWAVWTKDLLRDHFQLLNSAGYRVGKLFPRGVEFRDYDPRVDETFRGPNYVAVHERRSDLVAALRTDVPVRR
jgi:FkbM family methyltransferase